MADTENVNIRQTSAQLRVLLDGIEATVKVLHSVDGATWSINGDREAAAARIDASPDFYVSHESDWVLFVLPREG